jgi:hypothetical protein
MELHRIVVLEILSFLFNQGQEEKKKILYRNSNSFQHRRVTEETKLHSVVLKLCDSHIFFEDFPVSEQERKAYAEFREVPLCTSAAGLKTKCYLFSNKSNA